MVYYILTTDNNQILEAGQVEDPTAIPLGAIEIAPKQFSVLANNPTVSYEYINGSVRKSRAARINNIIQAAIIRAKDTCRQQIIMNLESSVLGSLHLYKNTTEDQINLADLAASNLSANIKCANIDLKTPFSNVHHTTTQIHQLYRDMCTHKFACLDVLEGIKDELLLLENSGSAIKTIEARVETILATQTNK